MPADNIVAHVNLARGFRGGERQTLLLAAELAKRGLQQRLLVRRGGELAERARKLATVSVIPCDGILSAARKAKGSALVHSHEGRSIQVGALSSLLYGINFVVTRRVMNPLSRNAITGWMYRRAAVCVGLSNAIASAMTDFDPRLKVNVIPSALAAEPADPERAAVLRSKSAGRLRVGNVAALEADSKGQWTLLHAAKAMPDVDFILVGSGRDADELQQAAAGLGNVEFTGQVRDVASFLASFDVFAFPSLREGLGSILLDAMEAGLPVVANRTGGIPDIISDSRFGRLVAPADRDGFVAALREFASSATLRRDVGLANQQHAKSFSVEIMATRYLDVYQQAGLR